MQQNRYSPFYAIVRRHKEGPLLVDNNRDEEPPFGTFLDPRWLKAAEIWLKWLPLSPRRTLDYDTYRCSQIHSCLFVLWAGIAIRGSEKGKALVANRAETQQKENFPELCGCRKKGVQKRDLSLWHGKDFLAKAPFVQQPLSETSKSFDFHYRYRYLVQFS